MEHSQFNVETKSLLSRPHPLHSISDKELERAVKILLRIVSERDPAIQVHFKNVSGHEPPKHLLRSYLDAEAAGIPNYKRPFVPRLVDIVWSTDNERTITESLISLDSNTEVGQIHPPKGFHASIDRDESKIAAENILSDKSVIEAIAKLNLHADCIVQCDAWMYGADKNSTPDTQKYIQALLYARAPHNHPESNQYAFPLPISPLYSLFSNKVVGIDILATGGKSDGLAYETAGSHPLAHCVENEYHPDLVMPREGLKPLHVTQPEGPSFTVTDENCINWQKWRFRVGFNYREGMTVHDVRYDGRPVFYRLSISEMTVPYGDPRSPYHRKQAMDLGDAGAGSTANNLLLGCDCLGTIKYFSGWLNNSKGEAIKAENVICLHEQDGGIGWKHTNHRTQVAAVVRARNLILQTVLTVGNYEYIFAWCFMQNGNIELETRATGILSTSLIDPNKTSPWGTVVSPGVLATNHQHLFSLRIDPMIGGHENTVFQEDSLSMEQNDGDNPHGNAWRVVKTPIVTSCFTDASPFTNRVFKISNESFCNPISGNPIAYKIVPQPCQLLLAAKDSVVRRRARFAEHHFWVTKYYDGDFWAAGKWSNQSLAEVGGLYDMAARKENVRDEDIVVWLTFGMTHNPRVEDFPVMPSEIITVALKPTDFFNKNPAIDVPRSIQAFNKSVLVQSPLVGAEMRLGRCCGSGKDSPKL